MNVQDLRAECNEIIIELTGTDADIFITPDVAKLNTSSTSKRYLEAFKIKLLYIRDEFAFAVLLKTLLLTLVNIFKGPLIKAGHNHDEMVKRLEFNFYRKNKNFIEQVWYWIVYYNLWYLIQFCFNIIIIFRSS